MNWWVYKCNVNQNAYIQPGDLPYEFDWRTFFDVHAANGAVSEWGRIGVEPRLSNLQPCDRVLAYQTNGQRLIGVVEMVRVQNQNEVCFRVVEAFGTNGVSVRRLRRTNPAIVQIAAFTNQAGRNWLVPISDTEAQLVIVAARECCE